MLRRSPTRTLSLLLGAIGCCSLTGCYKPTLQFVPTTLSMRRSLAIPDTYPLGNTVRDFYHQMETNGEAEDFVMHRHEFIQSTAELNQHGLDHLQEIAARMRSAPYPVLIERSEFNSDPELDQHRRRQVAEMLTAMGNATANARTIVSQSYDPGLTGRNAANNYNQFTRGGNDNGNNGGGGGGNGGGGNGGGGGGFGGGGGSGGGGGFGGGF